LLLSVNYCGHTTLGKKRNMVSFLSVLFLPFLPPEIGIGGVIKMNWIAFLGILFGNLLVGNKKKFGFVLITFGSILWMIVGFHIKDYALLLVNLTSTIIMVINWFKWRADERYWNSMVIPKYKRSDLQL